MRAVQDVVQNTSTTRRPGERWRAAYATDPAATRGRLIPEPFSPTRSDFQRDRDRIIHSSAFRRLKHKTQVFVHHEGDHYRTRLTSKVWVSRVR
ncbi:Deoxyguanosinetriphosphate triphosphohydrolase-like protein [Methylobacterium gnaphalii]|nr:Deoxyguanosinetriphosphate triphosphohydrolase-like protein [Methylobacterium gnaphalii]